ncbi:ABC transporter ATP-binding protein [Stella sp.]|uniref:ABC transporter ATP-binding protein n=1 Tax=Stella sp. TaxID=2912054 RepID=UPI0035B32823
MSGLRVADLGAAYGQAAALDGISLTAAPGEVVALLGRNGAGKSTTLKAVIGLVRVTAGTIALDGAAIGRLAPHERARLGVGYVPEERRIFAELTVAENLEVGRQPPRAGAPAWDEARIWRLFPPLAELRRRAGGRLSGGEQQMLAVARTLMGNPRLLLLDEPSEGIAPILVAAMAEAVRSLRAEGLTILLSEQNLRFAARVADRAYVLSQGRIAAEGAMAELLADRDALGRHLSTGP